MYIGNESIKLRRRGGHYEVQHNYWYFHKCMQVLYIPCWYVCLCTATSMTVESEAIGLRSSREQVDDVKEFVKTAFVLVVYSPPLWIR